MLFRAPQKALTKSTVDVDPTIFKVYKVFKLLEEAMLDDKENLIEKVRGIYLFKVIHSSGKEGQWTVDAKNGKGSVTFYGTGMNSQNHFKIILY